MKTTGKVVSRHLICGILRVLGTLHTSQGLWLEGLSRVGGKGGRPCGCWGTRQSKALRTQLRAPWTVWGKGVTPLDAHVRTTPAVPDKQPGTAQPPGLKLHTLGVGAIPWKQTLPPGPSQTPERAWMSRGRTRSGVGSRRTTAESYRSQCLFPDLQTSRRFYCQARARSPVGSHYAGAASPQPARAPTRPAPTPTPAASLQGSRFTATFLAPGACGRRKAPGRQSRAPPHPSRSPSRPASAARRAPRWGGSNSGHPRRAAGPPCRSQRPPTGCRARAPPRASLGAALAYRPVGPFGVRTNYGADQSSV